MLWRPGRTRATGRDRTRSVFVWTMNSFGGCFDLLASKLRPLAQVRGVRLLESSPVSLPFAVSSRCYWMIIAVLVLKSPAVASCSFVDASPSVPPVKSIDFSIDNICFWYTTYPSSQSAALCGAARLNTSFEG